MCDACAFITGIRRAFLSRGCALAFITLTLTCFSVSQLHAQVLYGSLTGNVSDVSNAPIPGAKIEAANVGTGIATEGVTDTRGVYLINNLQPGVYRVTIAARASPRLSRRTCAWMRTPHAGRTFKWKWPV